MSLLHVLEFKVPVTEQFTQKNLERLPRLVCERWLQQGARWALNLREILRHNEPQSVPARSLQCTVQLLCASTVTDHGDANWLPSFIGSARRAAITGHSSEPVQVSLWWAFDQVLLYATLIQRGEWSRPAGAMRESAAANQLAGQLYQLLLELD